MPSRRSPGSSGLPEARGLAVAAAEGPAAAAGLHAGDRILTIDGQVPEDVLDLELAAADGRVELLVVRGGQRHQLALALRPGEHHGVGLAGGLGVPLRRCANECRFCFVDQLPRGLRCSLYVKDDDYRLSFLSGGFITLSNLSEHDLERIEALRLSPLYVSLHDWDDERRASLMGKRAAVSRRRLLRLAAAGVTMHVQIVLCPGVNDGSTLAETAGALAAVDQVADIGVVPVSVKPGHELRPVTPDDAEAALALIGSLQRRFLRSRGTAFVYAADELYLLVGRPPPPNAAECQYENGIGIAAAFLVDAEQLAEGGPPAHPPLALLTGALARPVVRAACEQLGAARPFVVVNRLFGAHVTVTGLLGGREVLDALRERPPAPDEWLLAPAVFLPPELGVTLDDVPEAALRTACGGRLVVADSLRDAFARLPR